MRYISLFAGIGGFDLALDRLGHTCVYVNEWDKYAATIYSKHFSTPVDRRSITTVPTSDIPDHDLLVGGFPCQAFSIAGKRKGFDDTRGTLFFDVARILRDKRPRYFILENVKGLLSHDGGKTIQTIFRVLTDLGYEYQWQVLNSKNFGVPQNRERIFIVGHIRGESRPKVFPIREANPASLDYVGGILSDRAKKWLDNGKQLSRNFPQGSRVYDSSGLSSTLAAQAGGLGAKTGLYQVQGNNSDRVLTEVDKVGALKASNQANAQSGGTTLVTQVPIKVDMRNNEIYDSETAGTLQARDYKGFQNFQHNNAVMAVPVLTPDRVEKRQNGRRFKTDGEPAFTLTAQDKHGIYDGMKIRRLTPTECERLQGFPDGWTAGVSDTQRYKTLGNAVTVNVVFAVASRVDNVE